MVPSSLSQLPRSAVLGAGAGKSGFAARRPICFALRVSHLPSSFTGEKRTLRCIRTSAQPEEKASPVAQPEGNTSSATQSKDKGAPAAGKQLGPMQPFKAKDITDKAEWDKLLKESTVPVLADFWAPWCGPCRMIGPTLDELIDEFGDKLLVVKVNTDVLADVAKEHGIRSIPTCLLFKDGVRVDTIIGAVKKPVLKSNIEKYT